MNPPRRRGRKWFARAGFVLGCVWLVASIWAAREDLRDFIETRDVPEAQRRAHDDYVRATECLKTTDPATSSREDCANRIAMAQVEWNNATQRWDARTRSYRAFLCAVLSGVAEAALIFMLALGAGEAWNRFRRA